MNAEQMRSALVAFAALIGEGRRAHALLSLAGLFEGLDSTQVSKVVATIEGNWKASNRAPRCPADLKSVLEDLHRALEQSGATKQAKAFAAVLRLCSGFDDQSVDTFVAEGTAARVKRVQPRAAAHARTPLTNAHAKKLANELASAADDRDRFDALLDQMKRQFKVVELKTIADFYTGYETLETKKDDIVRAMRRWHRQDELNRDRKSSQAKAAL